MAVRNVGGHAVSTSAGGGHNMAAQGAQPAFPAGAGMTDSQRKVSGGDSYAGGSTMRGSSKKKFPPAS